MYMVIRHYAHAPELADELKKRGKEVEAEIGGSQGFIAYYLIKTSDGIASVTVCEARAGCDESTRRAASWLQKNMPNLKTNPPEIIAGELALKFATYKSSGV